MMTQQDKQTSGGQWLYHLLAFLTVAVWGTTFVSTKVLILNGLSPAQIFTLRFVLAYVIMVSVNHRRWLSDTWKDELMMAGIGITGGSLYFLSENAALTLTTATNTSLIVCSCPLFATLIIRLFYKSEHIRPVQIAGSALALVGMAIVVLNGHFVLHLSPAGDALAFVACLCWAVYSLLMKPLSARYDAMFITRKVFFYGVLTILPYYLFVPDFPSWSVLVRPEVLGNLLFLGCLASMICYLTWSLCMARLGAVKATNYVYFNPVTTIVFAWWILGEKITPYFILGSVLILSGIYLTNRKA